jgi:hypothetical protein
MNFKLWDKNEELFPHILSFIFYSYFGNFRGLGPYFENTVPNFENNNFKKKNIEIQNE